MKKLFLYYAAKGIALRQETFKKTLKLQTADGRGRISERKDVPLFDYEAFHEALLNAFVHNKWIGLNAPMISVFTDRIEILSHGGLGIEQDLEGFYSGVSIPVNEVLASIFLQLRLSERSGRGVPKIVGAYGRESIRIEKNFIVVTIPFNRINVTPFELNGGEKSEVTVKRAIARLKSENKIKRIGSDKTGHWEVKRPVHHSVAVDEFTI